MKSFKNAAIYRDIWLVVIDEAIYLPACGRQVSYVEYLGQKKAEDQ